MGHGVKVTVEDQSRSFRSSSVAIRGGLAFLKDVKNQNETSAPLLH